MMKKNFYLTFLSVSFLVTKITNAKLLDNAGPMQKQADTLRIEAGIQSATMGGGVGDIAQYVISAFLSLLAIIFVILVIIAGYNWMIAAGDESKVSYAKETIKRALIGLIIIAAAYAITAFVFQNIPMENVPDTRDGM